MEADVCPLHSAFGWDWRSLRSFRPRRGEVGSGLEEPKQGACQETLQRPRQDSRGLDQGGSHGEGPHDGADLRNIWPGPLRALVVGWMWG